MLKMKNFQFTLTAAKKLLAVPKYLLATVLDDMQMFRHSIKSCILMHFELNIRYLCFHVETFAS